MSNDSSTPVKIWFVDFWNNFTPENNFIINLLRKEFDVVLDPEPDCLIYSAFGNRHLEYDCIRIFYSGENIRPDYSKCDYAFTYDHDSCPRHVRWPMFSLYTQYLQLLERPRDVGKIAATRLRFCAMLVSNPKAIERIQLFKKLSHYKQVDSGGKVLNNIGSTVDNKFQFFKQYKFAICYENAEFPGYTSEKLIEALVSGCIPIYWGNPLISEDVNTASFINRYDFESDKEMVDHVTAVDLDRSLYCRYLEQPVFTKRQTDWRGYQSKVVQKFQSIFDDVVSSTPLHNQQQS